MLHGHTDSSLGDQDPNNKRSTSGYSFTLGGGPVSWSSKRQRTVATSTCEAEYIAQCNATKEAIWVKNLFIEVGYALDLPIIIQVDNESAIAIVNGTTTKRSRYIDL